MSDKKALVVIDMQNDYLWDKRKPVFSYDTQKLTDEVNRTIHSFEQSGNDVIYVAHILPNIVTNRIFIGFSIRNTPGAQLYGGLDRVSELYFEKNLSNSFTARKFREYMAQQAHSEIWLCGLDLCGCVGKTALGAAKVCKNVFVVRNATASRFDKARQDKMINALDKAGVILV